MSIEIKGVTKSFGSFQALHDIHLSIQAGEFIAILGPSGCGKTTLLRILAGFEQPSGGEVMIEDRIVAGKHTILPPEKRRIGMVFQSFALWPHMNVTEHIRFPIRNHKATPEHIKSQENQHISKILELTGLSHLANRMPHELSGGQKQRVAIARALASEPSLLLMDEPLSSLDAMLRMDMRREIQQVHQRTKSAIVYVTHDQGEALAMADRIVVMKDGRIEQVGTPQQIYLQPESEFVAKFVSKSNLVEGSWEQNRFIPKGSHNVSWSGAHIANYFKSNHMYPVRPDEFQLQKDDAEGISGEVINVQFQGKEFHYIIHANDHQWEVISPQHFVLHEKVKLNLVSSAELLGV